MNNNNDRFKNFVIQVPNPQSRPYPGMQPTPYYRPYTGIQNPNPYNRPYPGMQNPNLYNRPYIGMQNPNPQIRPFPVMQNPIPYNRPIPITANIISQNPKNTNVNLKKKPFFKKQAFIISMSSILGIGVVAVAVIVPLFLTTDLFKNNSFINMPVLNKMTAIYDLPNHTANLLISGENLPINGDEYAIYNVTNANIRAKVKIPSYDIKLNRISNNEINLAVYDESIISTSKYEVSLKNGESIVSTPDNSKLQPSFTILTQPQNQIIADSSVNSVDLSISISAISNSINGESLSYKWYISDNTSNWKLIPNSNTSNYTYNIAGLTTKKYFRCQVSYKYAPTITSNVVYVERVQGPTLSFTTQPTSVIVPHIETTTTLAVAVAVANPVNGVQPSYKWYISDSENSNWTLINNATHASYTYNVSSLEHSVKKYFKCEVNYDHAQTITSNIVYVQRDVPPGPTPDEINVAITAWNKKDHFVKTREFNSLMANSVNNEKIKDYMLKQGGMGHFFAANANPTVDNQYYKNVWNGLTESFAKYNIDNIVTKPFFQDGGKNFMSLKGTLGPDKYPEQQVLPNTLKDNINEASRYLYHNISSLGTYIKGYNFYSIDTSSYDIYIEKDFTLRLSNFNAQYNFIVSGASTDDKPYYLRYNSTLLFTDTTLFPGLSEFVKTTLLKL